MNKFPQISGDPTFVGIVIAKDSLTVFVNSPNQELEPLNQVKDL